MLSIRVLTRTLPRTACRSARIVTQAPRPTLTQSIRKACPQFNSSPLASFATSTRWRESEGQVNTELSAKLESEMDMEKDMRDPKALPDQLKEYLDNSPFSLQDTPGHEEVVLTRTFGDETIKVAFSIDDLNNVDEDVDSMQDEALGDEFDDDATDMPTDTQSGGANTKGAVNQGRTPGGNIRVAPEDSVAPADQEGDEDLAQDDAEPSFPSHLYITIERPKKGAIQVEATAHDGLIVIDNVYFYRDSKLLEPKSTADERAASQLYTGPPFGNLDEDLQVMFEKYLDERGINTTLALFVPEYIDYKEQKEYLNWLSNLKSFVD